ncbi:hypothetical protein M9H77_16995 [Catharanthus roseus]|uniref:Uncharacterized protein n=1 Tax=Catharanthus roseus TaxID=4058 RepID=A0ACC0B3C5_CATRO|nr:hypothetical protein M9H77_16995 [Catharanthus roseus]
MFIRIHQKNSDFFHLIRMDNEGRLDSIFWVHPRSKVAYEELNDMIQDVGCDYCWSQPSWPSHIILFSTPISRGQKDVYLRMGNAIKEVMLTKIWRYCIRHIMCKILDKFKGLMEQFCKARKEFRSLVYDNLTKSMFENNWNQFVTKYGLETNQRLIKLHSEGEH